MGEMLTSGFWAAALQIIVVDLLLSGDNAVVIALACRNLPARQRKVAVFWGVFGAVAARVVLTVFAVSLLALPWLKLVGGAMLLWIGVQLIAQDNDGEADIKPADRLLTAIRTVVMADVVMSLDNVIAVAAAARGHFGLLIFGLALSIPLVVFGSGMVMKLIERFPLLILAGGGLLGHIALSMAIHDPVAAPLAAQVPALVPIVPWAGVALVVAAGLLVARLRRGGAAAP